jgi:transcriptional regulator with PAS, ATPase and Fis domain
MMLVEQVASSSATVLIQGESGTGKELFARAIHERSGRANKPFVAVNCAALPETLLESELFGYERGAFTGAAGRKEGRFELADGGTLFLDEVADLSAVTQPKILRVLQEGEFERLGGTRSIKVDVRLVAASNQDLAQLVKERRFREDLFYRLNVITLGVPPLRDRREDIPALAMHFLRRHAARYRKPLTGFDAGGMQALLAHSWPGNIRELDHAIERAVLLSHGDQIRAGDLGLRATTSAAPRLEDLPLEDVEKMLIQKALARYEGNVSRAAQALGLSRSALYRRIASYGL